MSYSLAIDRMLNSARVHLPGALDVAIKEELFIVMDEFLKGSNIWKQVISVPIVANTQCYELVPTDLGMITRLAGVTNSADFPVAATMEVPGTLVLDTMPTQADTLGVLVVLTVSEPTTKDGFPVAPTWIADKYASSDWFDGILGRMMSQPGKPYGNQQLAVFHLRKFRNAIAKAKTEAAHKNVYRGQSWMFPQQFAVRHRR